MVVECESDIHGSSVGTERHFSVLIVSDAFEGLKNVEVCHLFCLSCKKSFKFIHLLFNKILELKFYFRYIVEYMNAFRANWIAVYMRWDWMLIQSRNMTKCFLHLPRLVLMIKNKICCRYFFWFSGTQKANQCPYFREARDIWEIKKKNSFYFCLLLLSSTFKKRPLVGLD